MEQKNKRQAKLEKKKETELIKILVKNAQQRDPRWKKYQDLLKKRKEKERIKKKTEKQDKKIKRHKFEKERKRNIQEKRYSKKKKNRKEKMKKNEKQMKTIKLLIQQDASKNIVLEDCLTNYRHFFEYANFNEFQQIKPIVRCNLDSKKTLKQKTIIKPLIFLFKISISEIKKKRKTKKI